MIARVGWGLLGVLLGAGCGTGDSLVGAGWKEQRALNAAYFDVVFERDGSLLANTVKGRHTVRFDVKSATWSDLGAVPGDAQILPPFLDLEGTPHFIGAANGSPTSTVYKLVDNEWQPVTEIAGGTTSVAFGKGGALYYAQISDEVHASDTKLLINRKAGADEWKVTFSQQMNTLGVANPYLRGMANDSDGNVHVSLTGGVRMVSEAGDALSPPFDCPPASALYCSTATVYRDDSGTGWLRAGGHTVGFEFYRLPKGEKSPQLVAKNPEGYGNVVGTEFDGKGNIYCVAAKDYGGSVPTVFLLEPGSTTWRELLRLPDFSYTLRVRRDGQIFAYDGSDGTLVRLMK